LDFSQCGRVQVEIGDVGMTFIGHHDGRRLRIKVGVVGVEFKQLRLVVVWFLLLLVMLLLLLLMLLAVVIRPTDQVSQRHFRPAAFSTVVVVVVFVLTAASTRYFRPILNSIKSVKWILQLDAYRFVGNRMNWLAVDWQWQRQRPNSES